MSDKIEQNFIPRRNDIQKNTECELCIRNAMMAIEAHLPASEKATEAMVKLQEVFEIVADIEDKVNF